MKTGSFLFAIILFPFILFSQTFVTVVNQAGTTKYAPTIDSALSLANNGDIIYVPAGTYDVSKLVINKTVHIIGAGYNYLANGADGITHFTGHLSIESGADGGSLQGVYMDQNIYFGKTNPSTVNNYTIFRCLFREFLAGPSWDSQNENSSNLKIIECIIGQAVCLGNMSNTLIEKCIIFCQAHNFTNFSKGTRFKNCVIIPTDQRNGGINFCQYTTFENNIFCRYFDSRNNPINSNQFLNNIYCFDEGLPTYGTSRMEGNIKISLDSVFISFDNSNFIEFSKHNFHLTQEAINLITGTDGTQVGIYGTSEPFKEYGIPVNPHVKKAKVNMLTNPEGKLKVEFEVEAQDR